MESHSNNIHLWTRNPQLHDDETITVGTVFRILSPLPVKNYMSGDLPLVETYFPVIVMKYPTEKIPTAAIKYSIKGNCTNAFVCNAAMLQ
eukprot:11061570-Ditylum_brightwellii.AAC.1